MNFYALPSGHRTCMCVVKSSVSVATLPRAYRHCHHGNWQTLLHPHCSLPLTSSSVLLTVGQTCQAVLENVFMFSPFSCVGACGPWERWGKPTVACHTCTQHQHTCGLVLLTLYSGLGWVTASLLLWTCQGVYSWASSSTGLPRAGAPPSPVRLCNWSCSRWSWSPWPDRTGIS